MSDIIAATFCDIRTVKGRKMLQLICEVPLENAEAAMSLLGFPKPADPVWVGIARLNLSAGAAPSPTPADNVPSDTASQPRNHASPSAKRERTPAERAGFLCTLKEFQDWAYSVADEPEKDSWSDLQGQYNRTEACIWWLRHRCGVLSRRQITENPDAHEAFKRIEDAFHRRNDPPSVPESERYDDQR